MTFICKDSPHYEDRKDGAKPSMIIIHYTGTKTWEEAEDIYLAKAKSPVGPISPHYMISDKGLVVQYVEDQYRAYHAGQSYWDGIQDVNSHSIGIELCHGGHEYGEPSYSKSQIVSLKSLCKSLMEEHNIKPSNVLGHSDVAPDRKIDPGEFFPWEELAKEGVGIWAEIPGWIATKGTKIEIQRGLARLGYNPSLPLDVILSAFQRHYEPDVFKQKAEGQPTDKTYALIQSLLSQKHAHS